MPQIPSTRAYGALKGRPSVPLNRDTVGAFDAVLIATDHDAIDYAALADWSPLLIDTRNVFARHGIVSPRIVEGVSHEAGIPVAIIADAHVHDIHGDYDMPGIVANGRA